MPDTNSNQNSGFLSCQKNPFFHCNASQFYFFYLICFVVLLAFQMMFRTTGVARKHFAQSAKESVSGHHEFYTCNMIRLVNSLSHHVRLMATFPVHNTHPPKQPGSRKTFFGMKLQEVFFSCIIFQPLMYFFGKYFSIRKPAF